MVSRKLRLKFLEKIGQTPPNVPTEEVAKTTSVSGNPPSFIASNQYPSIVIGFQSRNLPAINNLSNLLNNSLYYSSNGKIHLPWMKSNNFNFGTDQIPSADLKNLMNFTKVIYSQLFTNNGQNYKVQLTPQEIANKIKILQSNQSLNNLPAVQPGGQLATKVGGNVKNLIQDYLLQIK